MAPAASSSDSKNKVYNNKCKDKKKKPLPTLSSDSSTSISSSSSTCSSTSSSHYTPPRKSKRVEIKRKRSGFKRRHEMSTEERMSKIRSHPCYHESRMPASKREAEKFYSLFKPELMYKELLETYYAKEKLQNELNLKEQELNMKEKELNDKEKKHKIEQYHKRNAERKVTNLTIQNKKLWNRISQWKY